MQKRNDIKALFIRYVGDQISLEERDRVGEYLKTDEGTRLMDEVMDEIAMKEFESEGRIDSKISDEIYANLKNSMRSLSKSKPLPFVKQFYFHNLLKIAAVFIGLLIMAGVTYQVYRSSQTITYSTAYGQKETIVLPDLSTVTLNGNSTVTYTKGWGSAEKREVHLVGEAFFDVVRNEQKPFLVYTSDVEIKVLGTSFNVKSYDEDESIETTLVKGKVAIQNLQRQEDEEIILNPNEMATFSKSSERIKLTIVKTEVFTSWKRGKLIFEDETFGEIVKELERWYGVKIILKNEDSRQCRFTAKIENESLKEVLEFFKSTSNLKYRINEDEIIIEGNLCNI